MPFPSNPTDGQQAVLNGILYEYDSINDTWTRVVTNINFVTASFVGTNNSTNTKTGTIIVSGGAGIAGNLYANNVYSNGWFYASNGLPISFSGVSSDQFARDTANSAAANTVITQGVDLTQNTNITIIQGVDLTQNTRITAVEIFAQAAFDQANTGGGGGSTLDQYARDTANSASNLAQSAYNYANTIPMGGGGGPYIITGAQYVDYGWVQQAPSVVQFDYGTI